MLYSTHHGQLKLTFSGVNEPTMCSRDFFRRLQKPAAIDMFAAVLTNHVCLLSRIFDITCDVAHLSASPPFSGQMCYRDPEGASSKTGTEFKHIWYESSSSKARKLALEHLSQVRTIYRVEIIWCNSRKLSTFDAFLVPARDASSPNQADQSFAG